MKKIVVLFSACLLFSLMGYTQKVTPDEVPIPVRQAFETKFSAAVDVHYEFEIKDYKVIFHDKDMRRSANFDPSGKWLKTVTEIKESNLPEEVSASVARNFAGFRISAVTKTEVRDKGFIYEMDLKKDAEWYDVQFSPKGDVLKKTTVKTESGMDDK
jgi:hypothetical protein